MKTFANGLATICAAFILSQPIQAQVSKLPRFEVSNIEWESPDRARMDWVLANDTGEAFCNLMSVGPLDPNPANRLWALTIAKNPEGTWWGFPPHWLLYHAPEDPPFQFEVQRFPPGTTINASSFVYPDHFSSDGAERFAVEIILFRCSDSDALNLPTPLRRSDWMGDPPQPKALYSDGLIYLRSTLSDLLPPPADK